MLETKFPVFEQVKISRLFKTEFNFFGCSTRCFSNSLKNISKYSSCCFRWNLCNCWNSTERKSDNFFKFLKQLVKNKLSYFFYTGIKLIVWRNITKSFLRFKFAHNQKVRRWQILNLAFIKSKNSCKLCIKSFSFCIALWMQEFFKGLPYSFAHL